MAMRRKPIEKRPIRERRLEKVSWGTVEDGGAYCLRERFIPKSHGMGMTMRPKSVAILRATKVIN